MVERTDLSRTQQVARSTVSRASIRDFDDKHLMQEITKADVLHSETPSNFERFQMVGLTSVPLKQKEEKQSEKKTKNASEEGDWNHNQPKGESAEAIMLYANGHRSHPIALVDDRRVRPYAMKPGETALYAASGTGQMVFHNNNGSYLIAVNNPPEQSDSNEETERFASLRHVVKAKQSREIKEDQEVSEHKHEGETVNMEIRATSSRIEFRAGDEVVGYYDKGAKTWVLKGIVKLGDEDAGKLVHRKGNLDDAGNEPQPVYKPGTEVFTV